MSSLELSFGTLTHSLSSPPPPPYHVRRPEYGERCGENEGPSYRFLSRPSCFPPQFISHTTIFFYWFWGVSSTTFPQFFLFPLPPSTTEMGVGRQEEVVRVESSWAESKKEKGRLSFPFHHHLSLSPHDLFSLSSNHHGWLSSFWGEEEILTLALLSLWTL
jgi:hypothetical protein